MQRDGNTSEFGFDRCGDARNVHRRFRAGIDVSRHSAAEVPNTRFRVIKDVHLSSVPERGKTLKSRMLLMRLDVMCAWCPGKEKAFLLASL